MIKNQNQLSVIYRINVLKLFSIIVLPPQKYFSPKKLFKPFFLITCCIYFLLMSFLICSLYAIKFTLFSVQFSGFSVFTNLCNYFCYLIPEYIHHPEEKSHTHQKSLSICIPPCLSPWQSLIYFLSLWSFLFWMFHINELIKSVAFFTLHNVYKIHLCLAYISTSFFFMAK